MDKKTSDLYMKLFIYFGRDVDVLNDELLAEMSDIEFQTLMLRVISRLEEKGLIVDEIV